MGDEEKTGFSEWNARVAKLLAPTDDADELPAALLETFEAIAPSDPPLHHAYIVFNKRRGPIQRQWLSPPDTDPAPYSGVILEIDPFSIAIQGGRTGVLPLRDIAPKGFEKSAFYQEWFLRRGFVDGIAHVPDPNHARPYRVTGGVAGRETFTEETIARHRAAHPVIAAGLLRLEMLLASKEEPGEPVDGASPTPEFSQVLARLATETSLTGREVDVVRLALLGHNTESVAQQLEISWHTARHHRKQAYAKVGVSSQGELFYAFMRMVGLRGYE